MRSGLAPRRAPARRGLSAVLALAAALALAPACGGAGIPEVAPAPVTTCPIPVAIPSPTFASHVLPALRQSCGAGDAITCHGTPSPAGHVSYALSAATVLADLKGAVQPNAPAGAGWLLVAPGDPAHSWLLVKVTQDEPGGSGQASGRRMPLGAPNLCDATVQTLTTWIAQGAVE